MAMFPTYSFQDTDITMQNPAVGNYVFTGDGIGSVSIAMANDVTTHDLSADGTVMVSKIISRNGSINLALQQTSGGHRWLIKLMNFLKNAPASNWADTVMVIRSKSTGETITCYGVSPQKTPDRSYQAQGQQITWALMSAEIQTDLV